MKQCPICYAELEVRDCAPCHDCGGDPQEIKHFEANLHTYRIYEVYQGLRLTLCNFCDVDFGAYKSEYLGFKNGQRLATSISLLSKPLKTLHWKKMGIAQTAGTG